MTPSDILIKILCVSCLLLAGCAAKPDTAEADLHNNRPGHAAKGQNQPDLIPVIAALHDQMHTWQGTPYHWGGTEQSGVDCSGFVWRTLKDRFNMPMDRVTTTQLIQMGKPVQPDHLQPGDLVFFRIHHEMHVGFYDTDRQFLHASVSNGVMRSSLDNPYWKKVFWQARRLPKEYGARISFNYPEQQTELAKQ